MRKTISTAVLALALTCGSLAFAGTASAATGLDTVPAGCVSYTLQKVNGVWKLVPTTSGTCTSSSTGTSGSSGGSTGGTSTQGTTTNNCNTGCTATATGTGGRSR